MAIRPFWFTDTVALSGNGTGTLRLPVSAGEKATFRRTQFVGTSTFSITDIRDDSGQRFSNANSTDPITNTLLNDAGTDFSGIANFDPALELEGPGGLNIDLLDTSGSANTVRVVIEGSKEA